MTSHAGVLRSGVLLVEAARILDRWAGVVLPGTVAVAGGPGLDPSALEDRNLLLAARLLVAAALARHDSLGAHYRSDEPEEPETYALRPKASLLHD
jgi:L-aspartate oxidase